MALSLFLAKLEELSRLFGVGRVLAMLVDGGHGGMQFRIVWVSPFDRVKVSGRRIIAFSLQLKPARKQPTVGIIGVNMKGFRQQGNGIIVSAEQRIGLGQSIIEAGKLVSNLFAGFLVFDGGSGMVLAHLKELAESRKPLGLGIIERF